MKLRKLAQSTILLIANSGKTLLIDPGKYNLDPGRFTLETFPSSDILIITHKHADHFDLDLVKALMTRSAPLVVTNHEIIKTLAEAGINSQVISANETMAEHDFTFTAIETDHVVRGEYIINFGLVVKADGTSVYHTSDTRFIEPGLLPAETKADYLLLPISNRGVVMGIDDALVFAGDLKARLAIPLHYDSPKDKDRVDPGEFIAKSQKFGFKAMALDFNQEIDL